jgi:hypothetical protein
VVAKFDWLGPGSLALLTPIEPGCCQVDGNAITDPVRLDGGALIELGALSMRLHYPLI